MNFPYHAIDLTHVLDENTPTWNLDCGYRQKILADYKDFDTELKFRVNGVNMHAGIGTHMDSPAHCFSGGNSIDQIDLNSLICPCFKIDISQKSTITYSLTTQDILEFEEKHGEISKGSFVIVYMGWDNHWNNPKQYHNNYEFPSVSAEAALLFLERDIAGLGVDTLSPDRPSDGYEVHKHLLGNNKYIVENVAHATMLPETGSFSIALPLNGKDLSEAPIRLVGLLER